MDTNFSPLYRADWCDTVAGVSANSFAALKRAEARERMAALRRARKSRAAAWKEQRAASLFGDASKWRITNLREVMTAMADYAKR
jgi:hypothetical protein